MPHVVDTWKAEAMAESVVIVLASRFGPLPTIMEKRIYAADLSELSRLLRIVAVVPSLDALFDGYGSAPVERGAALG